MAGGRSGKKVAVLEGQYIGRILDLKPRGIERSLHHHADARTWRFMRARVTVSGISSPVVNSLP